MREAVLCLEDLNINNTTDLQDAGKLIDLVKNSPFPLSWNDAQITVIDEQVKKLSKMQVELLTTEGFCPKDYNEISKMIGELKEYMVNCQSYNKN